MAQSEEGLNSLLERAKEESEKAGLKLNIKKIKIMAPFYGKENRKSGSSNTFYFLGL